MILPVSDLLLLVWQSPRSSKLLQTTLFYSFYGWVIFHCIYVPHLLYLSHDDMVYMLNLKKSGTNELIYKTEIESWMYKTNLWLPKDKRKGDKLGDGDWHIPIYKIDN